MPTPSQPATRSTEELVRQKCRECASADAKLSDARAKGMLALVPGWSIEGDAIEKSFNFDDYHQTMAFVNATAWISHHENHHPDLAVHYNKCIVRYSTHSVGGLSENDFICAAKIEAMRSL